MNTPPDPNAARTDTLARLVKLLGLEDNATNDDIRAAVDKLLSGAGTPHPTPVAAALSIAQQAALRQALNNDYERGHKKR